MTRTHAGRDQPLFVGVIFPVQHFQCIPQLHEMPVVACFSPN